MHVYLHVLNYRQTWLCCCVGIHTCRLLSCELLAFPACMHRYAYLLVWLYADSLPIMITSSYCLNEDIHMMKFCWEREDPMQKKSGTSWESNPQPSAINHNLSIPSWSQIFSGIFSLSTKFQNILSHSSVLNIFEIFIWCFYYYKLAYCRYV